MQYLNCIEEVVGNGGSEQRLHYLKGFQTISVTKGTDSFVEERVNLLRLPY